MTAVFSVELKMNGFYASLFHTAAINCAYGYCGQMQKWQNLHKIGHMWPYCHGMQGRRRFKCNKLINLFKNRK